MIAVAGEALFDLVAADGVLRPFPGGGPFNTAVSLARLGVPVTFLARLSNDRFGDILHERLEESGVDLRYVLRGAAPTPLAVVHTLDGEATFTFYLTGTAYADLTPADLPELGPEVDVLHLGTLALGTDPPGSALEVLMERSAPTRLIVVDPNVRPAVLGDQYAYRRRFEGWAGRAHVIKLSDADADWLYPGLTLEEVAQRVLDLGTMLVVVTLGGEGAFGRGRVGAARVSAPPVEVVDTVGAGDAFGAGLLASLRRAGRLTIEAVGELGDGDLEEALTFATAVGALQCTRAGAEPPTLAEVEAFLQTA